MHWRARHRLDASCIGALEVAREGVAPSTSRWPPGGADARVVHGSCGEFKVLVNDRVVIDAGALTALGVVPPTRRIIDAVRAHLEDS